MIQKLKNKKIVIALAVCLVLMAFAVPAFATDTVDIPTTTLSITGTMITSNLFYGANLIILAVGGVVFLLVGIAFGGIVLRSIANMITSMRFF